MPHRRRALRPPRVQFHPSPRHRSSTPRCSHPAWSPPGLSPRRIPPLASGLSRIRRHPTRGSRIPGPVTLASRARCPQAGCLLRGRSARALGPACFLLRRHFGPSPDRRLPRPAPRPIPRRLPGRPCRRQVLARPPRGVAQDCNRLVRRPTPLPRGPPPVPKTTRWLKPRISIFRLASTSSSKSEQAAGSG